MKRLFIAIPIKGGQQTLLSDFCDELKRAPLFRDQELRWTLKKNYHLTLKFFGACSDESILKIDQALKGIGSSIHRSSMEGNHLGAFPSIDRARLIYLAVQKSSFLSHLHNEIDRKLNANGFSSEKLPFTPHITLGRFKNSLKLSPTDLSSPIYFSQDVTEFVLYESQPSEQGSEYIPLVSYQLKV